jgi:hypothetical protein
MVPSNVTEMSPLLFESTVNFFRPQSFAHVMKYTILLSQKSPKPLPARFYAQSCQDIACSPRVTAACWHGVGTELALGTNHSFFP